MRFALDTPLWLATLPLAALVLLLARRRRERGAQRLAAWLRAAAVALLVLALAGPRVGSAGEEVDVAFLVDASDSAARARGEALDWVARAEAGMDPGERAALGLFGAEARLEHGLRPDPLAGDPAVVVDGTASDLEQALRLGQGAVGSERRRRVVLLTDGRQTDGDLVAGARQLAEAGVGLDIVPLQGGAPADVLVERVDAPNRVRDGETYDVVTRLTNTGSAPTEAVVTLLADGAPVDEQTVTLGPGTTEVVVPRQAVGAGTVRYEARVASGGSAVTANDSGQAAVRVDGPPRVLVYRRDAEAGDDLTRALEAGGIPADALDADVQALPPLDALLDYDSVVLVDVPATVLGEAGMAALDAYVREAGHGLVTVGGDASYALGEYGGTPLEELLPVFASVTDPNRRPPVAEALVVDTSGSMAACHCSDADATGMAPVDQGGVNKTDIAREAVARAVEALDAQDTVGVLAFNTSSEWVIPLQQLPSTAVVDDGLSRLHPDGNTQVDQAVREAIDGLLDVDARLRHIVLFTDGFTNEEQLLRVAEEAFAAGITLSVVGTGEGTADLRETLRGMAEAGGGRFYPGRDLASIPNILATEVRLAVRPIVNEGAFFPTVTGAAAATDGLTESPPLLGYVATTSKPTARTLLRIGEENDPLLATWQAGLGTTTAWTSDARARWSADWVSWDRFSSFWSSVVKDTFPPEEDLRGDLGASVTPGGVRVRVELADDVPAEAEALLTVTGPDGERTEVRGERVALDAFEGTLGGLAGEGVYAVSADVSGAGGDELFRGTVTAVRSYPAEYAQLDGDASLLARAADSAGGRLGPDPATVFDAAGLATGEHTRELWPPLAILALTLAVAAVGLRRLRLERADWSRITAKLTPRPARAPRPARTAPPPAPRPAPSWNEEPTPSGEPEPEPAAEEPQGPARSPEMEALFRAKRHGRGR